MDLSLARIVGLLVKASILATDFALGLNATREDVAYLTRKPRLLGRSLLATYVATPLVAVLRGRVFGAPNARPQPIVAAYLIASTVAVIPYLRWRKARRGAGPKPAQEPGGRSDSARTR